MKTSSIFLLTIFCFLCLHSRAQDLDVETVKSLVNSGRFVFVVQTMVPFGGPSKTVDFNYDVKVSKDSITTYLPYIGRAYTGVMAGDAGVNFTSTKFDYQSSFKKNKWEVSIKPDDYREVKQLDFTIFENGHASLTLTPTNKQTINYYGYVKKN